MSARVRSVILERSIRVPGGSSYQQEFLASDGFDMQTNDDYLLIQYRGAHKCVPMVRVLECEFELAEELAARTFVIANEAVPEPAPTVPTAKKKGKL